MSFRTKVVAFGTSLLLLAAVVLGYTNLIGQPKLHSTSQGSTAPHDKPTKFWQLSATPERTLPPLDSEQEKAAVILPFPLNLNSASQRELELLPGIGPVLAERIVNYRDEIGEFTSVDQLIEVKGIGLKKLAAIRELVFVEP